MRASEKSLIALAEARAASTAEFVTRGFHRLVEEETPTLVAYRNRRAQAPRAAMDGGDKIPVPGA